jgi:hypothetical protein
MRGQHWVGVAEVDVRETFGVVQTKKFGNIKTEKLKSMPKYETHREIEICEVRCLESL